MSFTVYIALFAWPLVTLALFASLGSRRGLCISATAGYLLLPAVGIQFVDGLPPVNKDLIISASCLLGAMLFDPAPLSRFRLQWFDILPLMALMGWGISSLVNGLGIQDALLMWWYYAMYAGIAYYLGRCYLVGPMALRDLAVVIVASTMIYSIAAVIEMRLSPQFNVWIYGFQTFAFWETKRDLQIGSFALGGFRPRVFLPTGLALAIWMAAGTILAWTLWLGGHQLRIWKLKTSTTSVGLTVITVLCRGTGAFALMFAVIGTLLVTKWLRWKAAVLWIPAFVTLYLATALVGNFLPVREPLVTASELLFGSTRSGSLDFRFRHEDALVDKALQAPIFGWGGWNRNRVDKDIAAEVLGKESITDGWWIIILGQRGLVGLIGTYGWMLVPATLAVLWAIRVKAPPPALYLVIGLSAWSTMFALDQLLNGFNHPVQALVAGALGSFVVLAKRHASTPPPRVAPSRSRPVGTPDGRSPSRPLLARPIASRFDPS